MARSRMVGGRDRAEMEARRRLLSSLLEWAITHQMTPDLFTDFKKQDAELSTDTKRQLLGKIASTPTPPFLVKSSMVEPLRRWITEWETSFNSKTEWLVPRISRIHLELFAEGLSDYLVKNTRCPLGALIQLDIFGADTRSVPQTVTQVPHINLYEDMALHFNQAVKISKEVTVAGSDIEKALLPTKQLHASVRATVTFGIHCVEAYLNSIASDYLLRCGKKHQAIKVSHMELLTERKQDGKVSFVKLRDKILQYPKIIIGTQEPPFQESSCQAMQVVLEANNDYRNSIVHGSPGIDYGAIKQYGSGLLDSSRYESLDQIFQPKMHYFYEVNLEYASKVVDAVVELIQQIDRSTSGTNDGLFWLFPRNEEGVFPRDAFA